MTDIPLVLLVAMARNRVIGADGGMPWRLPTDLARYRRLTMGRPMIMGRRTLEAIGRLLDGRDSIVLSRDSSRIPEGALHATGLESALQLARACAARRQADAIMVVGGEAVFRQFLPMAAQIDMTLVDDAPQGDTLFPALDDAEWCVEAEGDMVRTAGDSADARFLRLRRRQEAI